MLRRAGTLVVVVFVKSMECIEEWSGLVRPAGRLASSRCCRLFVGRTSDSSRGRSPWYRQVFSKIEFRREKFGEVKETVFRLVS